MSDILIEKKAPNKFILFLLAVWGGILNFFKRVATFIKKLAIKFANNCKQFYVNFINGSACVRLSYFIMGFNNLAKKQFVKGGSYLLCQIGFIVYMVLAGAMQVVGFFTLGTKVQYQIEGSLTIVPGDNSMLMLLFGVISIVAIVFYVAIWLRSIKSAIKVDALVKEGKPIPKFPDEVKALVNEKFHISMLSLPITGVFIFTVLPILFMIMIAFTSYDKMHLPPGSLFEWVGFKNFGALFSGTTELGRRFLPVLGWTLLWAVLATSTNYIFGIILALLINRKSIKGKAVWRTAFVLTIAVPQFVTILTVRGMLAELGPINGILMQMGLVDPLSPIKFLSGSPHLVRTVIIFVNMWIGIPFTMLITTGILMNIPKELYEAATVDGASVMKMFLRITMPYVVFVTTPYLITQFIGNINNFNIIYLLSGGGPSAPSGDLAGQTDLLITWLYKLTVDQKDYNAGSVIGILTFIICAIASLATYQNTASYKKEDNFQ